MTKESIKSLKKLLLKYKDVFAWTYRDIPKSYTFRIGTTSY